jgi:hypothetical protein
MARCVRMPLAVDRLATGIVIPMRRHSFSRRFGVVAAGVFLALLAWLAFVPSRAFAGCSHLVTSRSDRWTSLMPSLTEEISPEYASNSSDQFQPTSLPQSPRRCAGLWCEESPSAPAAPVSAMSARAELWAWLVTDPIAPVTSCLRLLHQETSLSAWHRSVDILRPPRLPSSV